MKKKVILLFLIILVMIDFNIYSQNDIKTIPDVKVSKLFKSTNILPIRLSYSNKQIKRHTNDSTYIDSELSYQLDDGSWEMVPIKMRARGNNRLKNCYYTPLKIKIKKSNAAGTLFKGNKKVKLVLPCLKQKDSDDNIVKEYMAYKLYELISPYHYKTRLVSIELNEESGNKTKTHSLIGIIIEDIDKIAKRYKGDVIERNLHPLAMDDVSSVQNDFFQFMIGNTDFSVAKQHNQKLLFIDKKIIPVPFDFDMSGLVNASYATVPMIKEERLNISDVTQRLYRGFKRDEEVYQNVRLEFLDNKSEMIAIVDNLEEYFDNPKEFSEAKNYILSFYELVENPQKFKTTILNRARTR